MMVRFIFSISMFISLIPVCVFAQAEEDVTNFRKNAVELVERFYSGLPQFCMDKEYKRSFIQNNIDKNAKFKPDFSTDEPEQYLDINQYIQVFLYAYRPDIKKEEIKFVRNKFDYSQLYPTTDNRGYNLIVYFFNSIRTSKVSLQKEVAFYCTFPDKSNPDYILISQIEPKEKEVVAISGTSNSGSNTNSDNTTELYNKAVRFYTDSDYKSAFTLFKQLAESGNAKAQNYVGSMYQYNKGIAQNNIEAVKWFRKSADQGNSSAQCSLGYMYYSATGVSRNYAEAIKWFRESAEQGNSTAMYNMGVAYKNGNGVQKNNAEAVYWFKKAKEKGDKDADSQLKQLSESSDDNKYDEAIRLYKSSNYESAFSLFKQLAESGNADAQHYVGYMYHSALGVPRDYTEAVKWYSRSADQGNSMAMFNMGVMCKNGFGVRQSSAEAINWFEKAKKNGHKDADSQLKQLNVSNDADKYNKAVRLYTNSDYKSALPLFKQLAEAGNADAQNYVGIMYYKGNGVTRNFTEAVKWYRRSAEQGNMYGQSNLASMYESGWGISENLGEAARWYRKAAEQGLSRAQSNLGYMYQYGKGVSLNYTEAVKWYRKSAEQGNVSGQNNLGYMYHSALGVSRDYVEAVKWYRKSAEQGNSKAMYNLGIMYKNGLGVQKDTVEAVNWFKKAKENGDKDADGQLKQMGVINIKRTR